MAEFKTNVMRMLDKEKVPYTPHTYDHGDGAIDGASVAAKMGQDPARVFKTLVTQGAGKSYFVFVVPVLAELDLKKAAKSVGEKSVAMLHVADINKVTGYVRGGCSPLGMKKAYRTVFDRSALAGASIIVSGGRIGYQIELAPEELIRLARADTCLLYTSPTTWNSLSAAVRPTWPSAWPTMAWTPLTSPSCPPTPSARRR